MSSGIPLPLIYLNEEPIYARFRFYWVTLISALQRFTPTYQETNCKKFTASITHAAEARKRTAKKAKRRKDDYNGCMFRFLDHPSEALIEVEADTVEDTFRDAGLALFETMTDTSSIKPQREFDFTLEASTREYLLIDWLNRLILLHEVEKVFLCVFKVQILAEESFKLIAKVGGEDINQNHERRMHVKSATFGQFQWMEKENGSHLVRFVLDI